MAAAAGSAAAQSTPRKGGPTLCVFSKHLAFLDYAALARTLVDLQVPGCDLTVRPGGHVEPGNVVRDLPRAHAALHAQGVSLPMITTGLLSADDPAARPTLATAHALGVPLFKLGYYRYRDLTQLDETLASVKRQVDGLAALAKDVGIQGGFHNHSGTYVGAAMWDHWSLVKDIDPNVIGFYFDPYHATIEGGLGGWQIGFQRLAPRILMVAIKDFYWEKAGGKWRVHDCPLGEGMVDFPQFFKLLAGTGFTGPITLHQEFELEGPTKAIREERTLAAIEKDVEYLRGQINAAFGPVA
jgi:sugar phosphate isomerase/epimerase